MTGETTKQIFRRLLVAAIVMTLTLMDVNRASAVGSTPNAALYTYNLAANTHGTAITPAADVSVLVMGSNTTSGFRGVGHVTMLHIPSSFLEWVGINSTSNGTITQGYSGTAGTKIVQLDYAGNVWLTVAGTDSFYVENNASFANTGNVTVIW